MKKSLFLCFLVFLLFSCSNDEFDSSLNPKSKNLANESVVVISSYEDWFNLFGVEPEVQHNESKMSTPMLRNSGLDIKTISGYSSITNTSKYRTMFTSEMATQLGLYTGRIYQCYMKYVKQNVTIPSGYSIFENNSPNCGYQPINNGSNEGTDFQKRGYKMSSGSTSVAFTTHVFYVDVDEWGGNIKRDYPCSPVQIQWSYILWKY